MRATTGLSNPEAFRFDAVLENTGAGTRHRLGDVCLCAWGTIEEHAAATASAADLGGRCSGRSGPVDERVDLGCCDAGRQPPSIGPFDRNLSPDLVPIPPFERPPHGRGRVANAFEAVEDVLVAVKVPLGDLPVVRAGVARGARVGEHNPLLELAGVHVQADPSDAVHAKLN